jgi:uncharacterized protein (DUF58 family)
LRVCQFHHARSFVLALSPFARRKSRSLAKQKATLVSRIRRFFTLVPAAAASGPAPVPNPRLLFTYLPAGQSRSGVYRGRISQRGRSRLGPLRVLTRFPFGLFCGRMTFGQSGMLVVYPRLGRLTRGWLARHHESFAGSDRRERRSGGEGDFYGVRPWQRGDSRRRIHWRTSARAGKLMVRQFEQPRNRDVAVLLDLWWPEQPDARHAANVELAVSFAATVIANLCRKGGSSVYLGTVDTAPQYGGGPASSALVEELMERLAVVEAQHDDRLADLLADALARTGPGMEIVLISTRPVDLGDAQRFGRLSSDPARQASLRRVRVVDTSSEELGRYFKAE